MLLYLRLLKSSGLLTDKSFCLQIMYVCVYAMGGADVLLLPVLVGFLRVKSFCWWGSWLVCNVIIYF